MFLICTNIRAQIYPPVVFPNTKIINLESHTSSELYTLKIYIPPSYYSNKLKQYPTVYITDGDLHFETFVGIVRTLNYYNELPEIIIVGISYDQEAIHYETRRTSDLTPVEYNSKGGKAQIFLDYIKNTIIPFIENSFRTLEKNRIYAGHSFGALFGSFILFHEPNVFNKYILISPSYWWGNRISFEYEKNYSLNHSDLLAEVYLSVGEFEKKHTMIAHWKEMTSVLKSRNYKGLNLKSELIQSETHISIVPVGLSRGIRFVLNELN